MMIILLLMHSEWVAENIGCIEYMGGEWANYIIYIYYKYS